MSVFLVGCGDGAATPAVTMIPTVQTPKVQAPTIQAPTAQIPKVQPSTVQTALPAVIETESGLLPTVMIPSTRSEPPVPVNMGEVLDSAVTNLLNATSFDLSVHVVRAYRIIEAHGESRVIYGEFDTDYEVHLLPALKVHGHHEYRFDPQADFLEYDSYTYQENNKYLTRLDEGSGTGDAEEIDLQHIEPVGGDVYQTIVTYYSHAEFVTESDGIAVYVIEHSAWYKLKSAIGFADLGFLYMQENGEQLVEQYAAESYSNVETIRFTIYVAVDERVISKVEVDESEFMVSVWAEVGRALIEQGEASENLTRYEVLDLNGATYSFSNYNRVQDFVIPQ
jgi:hypothetical protein